MGTCENICICTEKGKKEVDVDNLTNNSATFLKQQLQSSYNYAKLIFIQLRIKRFLKRKKMKSHYHTKMDVNELRKPSKKASETNKDKKIKKKKKNLAANPNDPYSIISQNIRKNSNDQYLIAQDPFKTNNNNSSTIKTGGNNNSTNYLLQNATSGNLNHTNSINSNNLMPNDPREQEHNNIRKKYPKIEEDGFTYIGEWKNGKRDGFGVLSLKDISKYVGEFSDNSVYGFGILIRSDGGRCVGYWDDFKSNGLGYYIAPNKFFSKGYWENDRLNGYGIENWIKGQYEGDYVEGNKQGIGELYYEEIGMYRGEFDETLSGIGTFVFRDGRKYEGQWRNNKMHGYGMLTLGNGKSWFEGEFVDDKREGFGVFYSVKKIYVGMWRNSKLEGETLIIEDGSVKKQIWEGGKILKNLPNEHKIVYEKYINEFISTQKSKMTNTNK